MYQAAKVSRSEFVPIRNLRYHVRVWGEPGPGKTPLVMVHGWMDVAASYQFVVDEFARDHYIVAPDWRGYGLTDGMGADNYHFPDYLGDLDFLLDHYSPGAPVHLVGHSMGGNAVMVYAGIRPERIRTLVNLEGFGAGPSTAQDAPGRYARWMDELKAYHRGEISLKGYDTVDGVAERLMKTNRRLTKDKADWLARQWAKPDDKGTWRILGDASHRIVNANLYRVDEQIALYERIAAPTLCVEAAENHLKEWWKGAYNLPDYHERLKSISDVRIAHVEDAGHMLHHDQPRRLAQLIEEFIAEKSGE
ncbi:alpha/beta fold hydrolase [Ramlibacter sp.]|uniref:alpha/beta fold hydrolase n=1 Tax=Ramlibacter sp. TaxID=1917967 RepID=UPI003D0D1E93